MRTRLSRKRIRRRIKKQERAKSTYTKTLVSILTVLAALWISWSYILATTALLMYGNVDPLSTVSEEVCRTVIATVLGYCVKSLAENISKYTVAGDLEDTAPDPIEPEPTIYNDQYFYDVEG